MLGTIYEEYTHIDNKKAFILRSDIVRTNVQYSRSMNWHDNLEIEYCSEGEGKVLLDGVEYEFKKDDIIIVNSNVIHYTSTDSYLKYSALIVSNEFCKEMGIDYNQFLFDCRVRDKEIVSFFNALKDTHNRTDMNFKGAKENGILLGLLTRLAEKYAVKKQNISSNDIIYDNVKSAIKFIRENYDRQLSLDEISRNIFVDKYVLSRQFKKITGKTVIEYINNYRCQKSANIILEGGTVTEAALSSGFENLSFFTRTFKKYIGVNPSEFKNRNKNQNL